MDLIFGCYFFEYVKLHMILKYFVRDVRIETFGARVLARYVRLEMFGTRCLARDVRFETFGTKYLVQDVRYSIGRKFRS